MCSARRIRRRVPGTARRHRLGARPAAGESGADLGLTTVEFALSHRLCADCGSRAAGPRALRVHTIPQVRDGRRRGNGGALRVAAPAGGRRETRGGACLNMWRHRRSLCELRAQLSVYLSEHSSTRRSARQVFHGDRRRNRVKRARAGRRNVTARRSLCRCAGPVHRTRAPRSFRDEPRVDVLTGRRARHHTGDPPSSDNLPSSPAALLRAHRWLIGLILLALIVRLATLGAYPVMDTTEARYAEIARKMVETGDWVTPQYKYGVAFWSKPPLSTWITAIAYLGLGVSEFAARLPSLLACLLVAWMTFRLAARKGGVETGLFATVVLVTTPLYFVAAGAVMTDAVLVLGTTLSMAGFWEVMTRTGRPGRLWGYGFFLGLAIGLLAKGPVGIVLTLVPVGAWALWKGDAREVWKRLPWVSGLVLTIALAIPWYVLAEQRTPGFLEYFLIGEHWRRFTESGWKGDMFGHAHSHPRGTIWLFAVAATLPWCVLWVALLLQQWRAGGRRAAAPSDDGWREYVWLWVLTPAVFFTFAGNILPTYVLPGLPAFALLVAATWAAADKNGLLAAALRFAALTIPIIAVLGVLFVLPGLALTRSHQALVAEYYAKRESDAQRLVYLGEAPQSAEFYARGKVITVP